MAMLIDDLATLKAKIKELLRDKNIKKIDLICADFYLLHTILMAKDEILDGFDKSIFKELLDEFFKLLNSNDRLEICIHTLGAINEEMKISDLQEDKTSYILSALRSKLIKEDEAKGIRGIRLINYKPNNIFVSFLYSLRLYFKEEKNKDIESIGELLEALGDEKLTSKDLDSTTKKSTRGRLISLMQEHKELIKAQIDLIQENQIFDELIKEELKEGFEQSFKALLEYINEFAKDNEGYKVLTSTLIISLMSIFMGGFVGFVGVSFATLDLVLTQMKNKQVFLNPLLEFLVSEFAIFAKHINTKLLSSALIVQKDKQRSLLDLSCLCMGENLSFYSSNLAYVAKLDESFDIEIFFKQAQSKINSQTTNKASQEKQAFELNSNFKLSLQHSLKAYVKEQVNKFNHFAYIQAPHFNSSELALLFSDKNNKTASAMSKNYLLITNAPNKYNAKLTELLTEQITNNKIIAKHRTKNKAFSFDANKKSYDSGYSNFRIDIEDKDDKPYILQLCLFQRMSKQDYERQKEEFKEFKSECEKLSSLMNMANYLENSSDPDAAFGYDAANKLIQDKKEALNKKFAKKEFSLPYISSHFKQNTDKEDIIIREKEIIKEYLGLIERFLLQNITLPKIKKSKAFIKPNYSLFECFIISYSMYHIACKFPSVNLKTKSCFVNILELINSFFLDGLDLASIKSYSMYECIEYDGSKFYMYLSNFTLANTDKKSTSFIQNTLNAFYQGPGFKNQSLYEELKKDLEEPFSPFEKDLIGLQIEPQIIQKFQEETKQLHNLEELLMLSFFKILASIFPFMNFFIDEELKNYEHCFKIFTLLLTEGLDRTFLNELGLFHLLKHKIHPDKSFIKISINDELLKAKGSKRLFLKLDLIHTQKQKALFEKKQALITDKINDIATVNKISHQAAKTRLINELYIKGEIQVGKERLTKNDAKLLKNMSFYHSNNIKHQRAMIGHIQLKNILFEAKKFHKEKIYLQVKANFIETLVSLGLDLVLELIFPSTYEAMQKEYEKIIHKFYTFKYDAPLAVEKEDYVYYPMRIDDKTMSFDFKDMIYGLELCTGVLSSHLSLVYNLYYEDSKENKEFALRRLLSYLIIDEKRGVRSKDEIKEPKNFISDKEFFSQGYKNIDIEHCSIYQLETTSPLYKEFRIREKENGFRATITAPIRLYNEALSILEDYANNYFTNTLNSQNKYVFDKRKARILIKALDLIGQNNLKALYIKESNLEHKYLKKLRQTKANEKMQTLNKYNTKQGSKKII